MTERQLYSYACFYLYVYVNKNHSLKGNTHIYIVPREIDTRLQVASKEIDRKYKA